MNLWEGNNFIGIWGDEGWGTASLATYFRNTLRGWQNGKLNGTTPVSIAANIRVYNIVGNILGQPGYHNLYEAYATSSTSGINQNNGDTAIYSLGWTGNTGTSGCIAPPSCDTLTRSTLMRWGNYDPVTSGVKWDSKEASPAAVPYVNANFTSTYFVSLAQTLPSSLYYSSRPSWWPTSKPWPSAGPDVTSGNLGLCTGLYAGAQATAARQCAGGTLSPAYAGHTNSLPAQDCYLNVMHGPPDGTGTPLNFDANLCYSSNVTKPSSPTALSVSVR
jgi:hypothetical protein